MAVKNFELFKILNAVHEILKSTNKNSNARFRFFLEKNRRKLVKEIEDIEESNPFLSKEYNEDRKNYLLELAEKDKEGKVIWEKENIMPKYKKDVNIEEKLTEFNKKKQEEYKDKIKGYNEILNEDSDIRFYPISIDKIPDAYEKYIPVLYNLIKE